MFSYFFSVIYYIYPRHSYKSLLICSRQNFHKQLALIEDVRNYKFHLSSFIHLEDVGKAVVLLFIKFLAIIYFKYAQAQLNYPQSLFITNWSSRSISTEITFESLISLNHN